MASVTIAKEYLDTLLRRAGLHDEYENKDVGLHPSSIVSIPKQEYEALVQSAREYACLRVALVNGGVPIQTLDLLTNDLPQQPVSVEYLPRSQSRLQTLNRPPTQPDWSAEAPVFIPQVRRNSYAEVNTFPDASHNESVSSNAHVYSYEHEEASVTSASKVGVRQDPDENQNRASDPSAGQRSLVMKGLPHRATLSDVVKVIRGGQLLNVYIRPKKRLAHISFVEAAAVEAFLLHSKRHAISILGKRVGLVYDDRQFYMPGHVSHKISQFGATRNLVIRQVKGDTTMQSIRNDLKHIHHLEVVDINIVHREAYVSLNSVHNAITARSCMKSQLKYKGCGIEYFPDECEQPFPALPRELTKKRVPSTTKAGSLGVNRFQRLADDENEEETDNEIVD